MKRKLSLLLLLAFSPLVKANDTNEFLSTQFVSFTHNEVFYQVYLDGSFTFTLPAHMEFSYRGQRAKTGRPGMEANMSIHYSNNRSTAASHLVLDHSGILYAIGDTQLIYNETGQLQSVGSIQLGYTEGRLQQIGGLSIYYDPMGLYSHTYGSITFEGTGNNSRAVRSDLDPQNQKWTRRNRKIRYSGFGVINTN